MALWTIIFICSCVALIAAVVVYQKSEDAGEATILEAVRGTNAGVKETNAKLDKYLDAFAEAITENQDALSKLANRVKALEKMPKEILLKTEEPLEVSVVKSQRAQVPVPAPNTSPVPLRTKKGQGVNGLLQKSGIKENEQRH